MPDPDDRPGQVDYAIDPEAMEEGIRRYLWPVTTQLTGVRVRYELSREEVKAAHDSRHQGGSAVKATVVSGSPAARF